MDKIIIFFHIYYTKLIDEYLWYLNNLKKSDYTFDLYISICDKVLNDEIRNKLTTFKSDVIITICENRGADIGGFFHTLRKNKIDFTKYEAVLYLHTKQSNHLGQEVSYKWRGNLLNDILILPDLINYCVKKIKDDNIGIIGSNKHIGLVNESLIIKNDNNTINSR
jgi:lipopolysaccharide biosynthesis protein